MTKSYMVVRNGVAKKTGEVFSVAHRLCQKQDKTAAWLDEKDTFWTDNIRPVGSIIKVEQSEV